MMLRGASTAALAIFLVIITYGVYRSDDRANLNDTYDECVVNEMRGQMEPEARSPGLQIDAIAGRRGD